MHAVAMMARILAFSALAFFSGPGQPLFAQSIVAPDALAKGVTDEVIAILRADRDAYTGNPAKVIELIESKVLPHFNFVRMTQLAVGKNWRRASAQPSSSRSPSRHATRPSATSTRAQPMNPCRNTTSCSGGVGSKPAGTCTTTDGAPGVLYAAWRRFALKVSSGRAAPRAGGAAWARASAASTSTSTSTTAGARAGARKGGLGLGATIAGTRC